MALAAAVPIWVKLTPSGERSIWKPSSFVELSIQLRLIWLVETVLAVSALGAAGTAGTMALVIALTLLE